MKMKLSYRTIGWLIPAALVALSSVSCAEEPLLETEKSQSLVISPALLDLQDNSIKTRALGDDDLKDDQYNENVVNRLDVFFFKKSDNSFVKAYHQSLDGVQQETHGDKTGYLLSNDWKKDGLAMNTAYTVYIIANSANETITGATSATVADLQSLVLEDQNIYKRQKTGVDSSDPTYTSSKAFLMNTKVDSWTITSQGTQLINDATVTLNRAAVKFVVDVSLDPDFLSRLTASGEQYGVPSWKFVNFNVKTAEVPGGAAIAPELVTAGSQYYLSVESGDNGHYTVVTYGYPQTWTTSTIADGAPAIFLSFPSRPLSAPNATPAYHYYYIPLCAQSTTATVSNNLYKVNAVISSFGSTEAISSTTVNLNYEVIPWGTPYSADIKAETIEYLVVTPTKYTFKGGSTSTPLTTTFRYYANGTVTVDQESIIAYYIDKNGDQQDVTSGFSVGAPTNGQIVVSSSVPTNGTYRYLEFTVKCGNKSQVVKIRHYPLDFVAVESGSYSSYDRTDWAQAAVGQQSASGGYIHSYVYNNQFRFSNANNNNDPTGGFRAKLYTNNTNNPIHYLSTNGGDGGAIDNIGSNNKSYVLQITSSSDDYVLGRPTITYANGQVYNSNGSSLGTVTYKTSNDDVISPAFMIASQLGAVTRASNGSGNFTTHVHAAIHCALYKEVLNGVSYSGWRLPTQQEVKYMIDNQYSYGDVMAEVLGGRYYWTLDGSKAENTHVSGSDDFAYTRCVRDLTVEELAEINKFE